MDYPILDCIICEDCFYENLPNLDDMGLRLQVVYRTGMVGAFDNVATWDGTAVSYADGSVRRVRVTLNRTLWDVTFL